MNIASANCMDYFTCSSFCNSDNNRTCNRSKRFKHSSPPNKTNFGRFAN